MRRAFAIVSPQAWHFCQLPGRPKALGVLSLGSRPSWSFVRMRARMAFGSIRQRASRDPRPGNIGRATEGPPAEVHRDPFHQQLVLREDRVAGVACFAVAWTTNYGRFRRLIRTHLDAHRARRPPGHARADPRT